MKNTIHFWLSYSRMKTSYFGVLLLLITGVLEVNCKSCHDIRTVGWTDPAGDIVLPEGATLNITCLLDPITAAAKNYSSHQIYFTRNNETLPPEFVTIINNTAAMLVIKNVSEMNYWFSCILSENQSTTNLVDPRTSLEVIQTPSNGVIVCQNLVAVGKPPKDVENVTCISYDWKVLNCSWSPPDNNVKTTYRISYATPKRAGGRSIYECPLGNLQEIENRCSWTTSSNPVYRRNFEYLDINMVGKNLFGEHKQAPIRFHHYAHILPSMPVSLQVVDKTTSSIYLKWELEALSLFEKGWVYNVSYTRDIAEGWNTSVFQGKDLTTDHDVVYLNITNLKYPNALYDIRVSMKSAVAQREQKWSENATVVVKTKACIPYRSPRTDIGSFDLGNLGTQNKSMRIVYIYWQPLNTLEYNGDNFRYEIVVFEDGKQVEIKPLSSKLTYAKFNISSKSYTFYIYSANDEGRALVPSRLDVPSTELIIAPPIIVSKVDYSNGLFEVSWKSENVSISHDIQNYTVFWCESVREYPYQCDGFIDWIHLPANINEYNFTLNLTKGYQFAVSANAATGASSGMIWSSCTVVHNRVTKIKNVWVDMEGSYFALIKWKLECPERIDALKGYYIYYCLIESPDVASNCSGPLKNVTVHGHLDTDQGNITDLEPFKHYKISVAMFTANSTGPHSDVLIAKTNDGKPDMCNVRFETSKDPTNTSISLRWTVPEATHGVLKNYVVTYNNGRKEVSLDARNKTEITLNNLTSFEEYSIKLQACTLSCSDPTVPIKVWTKIGKPGKIKGSSQNINATHVVITWAKPEIPGGPNPTYRVRIKYLANPSKGEKEFRTVENNTIVDLTSCTSGSFAVQIRAENIAENKEDKSGTSDMVHPGEWSDEIYNNCSNGSNLSTSIKIVIGIVLFILSAAITIIAVKKFLFKCQEMQKVEVSLPQKFMMAPTVTPLFPSDIKEREFYEDFSLPPSKLVEESCNLVDKSTELNDFSSQPR